MKTDRFKIYTTFALMLLTNSTLVSADSEPLPSTPKPANSKICNIVTLPNASLASAKQQFVNQCKGLKRQDCDPISGNRWMCSTDTITAETTRETTIPQNLIPSNQETPVSNEPDSTEPTPSVATPNEGVPWEETFSVPDGSVTSSADANFWAADRIGGNFSVQYGALTINGDGSEGVLTTDVIDIAGGPVEVSLNLSSKGGLESDQDYVRLFKIIDGGDEELIGEKLGVQSPTTIKSSTINGKSLQLVIRAYVSYASEYYYLDNLKITRSDSTVEPIESSANQTEHTYKKTDGPFKNPLKGWNSGWDGDNDHPESSVGFQYIPWKVFEPRDGNFDRNAVENIISRAGSRNRHLILRLYCDWHGDDAESDCPEWMYSDAGVARLKGGNGRYITDFNDPNYIAQAQQAIQALASMYDNDPRIYAVQMGVIGYWGEWHAWDSSFNGNSYDITDTTQNAILNAYKNSFQNAKIMARYPWREPTQSTGGIGYHNDYFVIDNGHSEEFDVAVTAGNQWLEGPIGGEVPPRGDSEANGERDKLYSGATGERIIEAGRYSTMKAGAYRVTKGEDGYEGYMRLHKKMGYNYQIDVARFSESVRQSEPLMVSVIGTNIGVAPMYFNWEVQFALLDSSNTPVSTKTTNDDLTSILPDAILNFNTSIDLDKVDNGTYKLAIRVIQPGADKPKDRAWKLDARHTYILFSNEMPVIDGRWVNNKLVGGWSVLGNVSVQ